MVENDKRIVDFATVLQLEKMARSAKNLSELSFVIMNETNKLVKYKNAFMWFVNERGGIDIFSASGVEEVDKSAPLVDWLKSAIASFAIKKDSKQFKVISADDFPKKMSQNWQKYMSKNVFWYPLLTDKGDLYGGIWIAKDNAYVKRDLILLDLVLDIYKYFIALHKKVNNKKKVGWGLYSKIVLVAVVLGLCMPIRQTVVAPASIVPKNPSVVNSPINGVIKNVLVEPNSFVSLGDNIALFDDTEIKNRYNVSVKTLRVVEAELKKSRQLAFSSPQDQANVKLLEAKLEQQILEVEYNRKILDKILIKSPANGVAIFGDKNDLIGKPVSIGERLIVVASPEDVELEVMVPAADAISLENGGKIDFFLNINSLKSYSASIYQASYEPIVTPEGVASYKVKASINSKKLPRVGLKANAKIYGKKVSVFYYLFRRPIGFIRQKFGL